MLNLLLIGGGENGSLRADGSRRPLETLAIDEYFVDMTGMTGPRLLFIPTATEMTDPSHCYEQGIRSLYGDRLGCRVDVLYLTPEMTSDSIGDMLDRADAFYIGGGDTGHMMRRWRDIGLDAMIKKASLSGKPIAGISAGAMCWFDRIAIKNGTDDHFMDGIGLFKNFCIPHWNKHRSFAELPIAKESRFAAIDECAAVCVTDNQIKIIRSRPSADAYFCQVNGKLTERELKADDLFD